MNDIEKLLAEYTEEERLIGRAEMTIASNLKYIKRLFKYFEESSGKTNQTNC